MPIKEAIQIEEIILESIVERRSTARCFNKHMHRVATSVLIPTSQPILELREHQKDLYKAPAYVPVGLL